MHFKMKQMILYLLNKHPAKTFIICYICFVLGGPAIMANFMHKSQRPVLAESFTWHIFDGSQRGWFFRKLC